MGRRATTAATVLLAVVANVVTGVLVALSLVSVPLPAADSIALGAGQAAVSLVPSADATTATECSRLDPAPRAPGLASPHRSGSPGACSAAPWSAGRLACS